MQSKPPSKPPKHSQNKAQQPRPSNARMREILGWKLIEMRRNKRFLR